ncbi:MAG: type II toxin-antitoxin system HicA family toxin [Oscillospiraceae bacterium]|nr:type II toxin-antitoxin system HicA family toxin [Oscillospiraceae bacterium]
MTWGELKRKIKKSGGKFCEHGKKHDTWLSKDGEELRLGRHDSKEVATGTINKLLKDAGLK